jgi:lipopolysaccharide transport system permease protein
LAQSSASPIVDPSGLYSGKPLPLEPTTIIESGRSTLSLSELWRRRELVYLFAWRDVRVRYRQTALGLVWILLQPLAATVVFAGVLRSLSSVPSEGVPYPLFAYAGLLPWMFFASAVTNSGASLVANAPLLTKTYFPRLVFPAAAVASRLVDLSIGLLPAAALMARYGVRPGWTLAALPVAMLMSAALALALGILIAAMTVRYRDLTFVLQFGMQLWMFLTPVLYPFRVVPERWRWVARLNPAAGPVEAFRGWLLRTPVDLTLIASSVGGLILLFGLAVWLFRRADMTLADHI